MRMIPNSDKYWEMK